MKTPSFRPLPFSFLCFLLLFLSPVHLRPAVEKDAVLCRPERVAPPRFLSPKRALPVVGERAAVDKSRDGALRLAPMRDSSLVLTTPAAMVVRPGWASAQVGCSFILCCLIYAFRVRKSLFSIFRVWIWALGLGFGKKNKSSPSTCWACWVNPENPDLLLDRLIPLIDLQDLLAIG